MYINVYIYIYIDIYMIIFPLTHGFSIETCGFGDPPILGNPPYIPFITA